MIVLKNFVKANSVSAVRTISKDIEELYAFCTLSDVDNMILMQSGSLDRRLEILNVRALIKECGLNLNITYKKRKPQVQNGYISISHSDSLVAIVWNSDFEIAVDIEEIGERIIRISKRAFSEKELEFANNNLINLHLMWGVKECVYKLAEVQGLEFKSQIHIYPFSENEKIKAELYHQGVTRKFLCDYQIVENHCLTWGNEVF